MQLLMDLGDTRATPGAPYTWATLRARLPHQWNLNPLQHHPGTSFYPDVCHHSHLAERSATTSNNTTICLSIRPIRRSPMTSNRISVISLQIEYSIFTHRITLLIPPSPKLKCWYIDMISPSLLFLNPLNSACGYHYPRPRTPILGYITMLLAPSMVIGKPGYSTRAVKIPRTGLQSCQKWVQRIDLRSSCLSAPTPCLGIPQFTKPNLKQSRVKAALFRCWGRESCCTFSWPRVNRKNVCQWHSCSCSVTRAAILSLPYDSAFGFLNLCSFLDY